MWEDKPKYISNKEAYKSIASELGIPEKQVKNIVHRFFLNLKNMFIKKQVNVTIYGFGKLKRNKKGNALFDNRRSHNQMISNARHSDYNRFSRKR
jgi:nucleoid DNA-binding protein